MTLQGTPDTREARVEAVAERLFATGAAALEGFTIALGRRLGLYAALASRPDGSTFADLARAAEIHPRYAREWLEQQAAAEILEVVGESTDADSRRYAVCEELIETLLTPDSPASMGPLIDAVGSIGTVLPRLVEAYRSGDGVPYGDYPGVSAIQAGFNRPFFTGALVPEFLASVPGLSERLAAPGARVADLAAGSGGAAIEIAKAWPTVSVDAADLDAVGLAAGASEAADVGVADRVCFVNADIAALGADDATYDLVLIVEAVHDLARPVAALAEARRIAKPDGLVVVIDERAPEEFTAPSDEPVERVLYAISVLHCLPATMAQHPFSLPDGAATGTVMRPSTLRNYAVQAGFTGIEVLPAEHEMLRGYVLR